METRLASIMRKADLRSTVDLIRYAIWVGAMDLVFWKELIPFSSRHDPAFPSTRLGISPEAAYSPYAIEALRRWTPHGENGTKAATNSFPYAD